MTNPKKEYRDRNILREREIQRMIKKADKLPNKYFMLRAKALIGVFRTGKRVKAVSELRMKDLELTPTHLTLTFRTAKKRIKKGLAQQRRKRYPRNNLYAQHIINYWDHMKQHHPKSTYLFPSTHSVFGKNLSFSNVQHLSTRQILRVIKQLNKQAWCHLFRETRASEIVREDEQKYGQATLMTVYRVQHALDLKLTATAYRYIDRYATETVQPGIQTITV